MSLCPDCKEQAIVIDRNLAVRCGNCLYRASFQDYMTRVNGRGLIFEFADVGRFLVKDRERRNLVDDLSVFFLPKMGRAYRPPIDEKEEGEFVIQVATKTVNMLSPLLVLLREVFPDGAITVQQTAIDSKADRCPMCNLDTMVRKKGRQYLSCKVCDHFIVSLGDYIASRLYKKDFLIWDGRKEVWSTKEFFVIVARQGNAGGVVRLATVKLRWGLDKSVVAVSPIPGNEEAFEPVFQVLKGITAKIENVDLIQTRP